MFPVFEQVERGESIALLPAQAEPGRLQTEETQAEAPRLQRMLAVMSSGTNGNPKVVWREWVELKREVRITDENRGWTWASPFQPWTFAGVQVALQAWATGGTIIQLTSDWDTNWNLLASRSVDALSCTPTFLDLLCLSCGEAEKSRGRRSGTDARCSMLDKASRVEGRKSRVEGSEMGSAPAAGAVFDAIVEHVRSAGQESIREASRTAGLPSLETPHPGPLPNAEREEAIRGARVDTGEAPVLPTGFYPRQITLGGEPLRPELGRRVEAHFPTTRFTVVYASAELGTLLKTHRLNGWYEMESLNKRFSQWRICDGILEVKMAGEWRSTRDLVEQRDNLLRVVGRADAVANVAGTKVNLESIATLAETVSGVRMAVAIAEPNDITGEVVCLRIFCDAGADQTAVQEAVAAHLRARLPKEAWPRRWEFGEITVGRNAKREVGGQQSEDSSRTDSGEGRASKAGSIRCSMLDAR